MKINKGLYAVYELSKDEKIVIETYHDHRMAMAFAPVAILRKDVLIDDPQVVKKSYPEFWEQLQELGFAVEEK